MFQCVIVGALIGGIGNQLFILTSSIIFARNYNLRVSWPIDAIKTRGLVESPTYFAWNAFASGGANESIAKSQCLPVTHRVQNDELTEWPHVGGKRLKTKGSFEFNGVSMRLSTIYDNRNLLRPLFDNEMRRKFDRIWSQHNNLVIGFRSYAEEGAICVHV
jgi:hypothetical protein